MNQLKEMLDAIDYLDKYWPKGHKDRGTAMVLLALAQIGGRAEQRFISSLEDETKKGEEV